MCKGTKIIINSNFFVTFAFMVKHQPIRSCLLLVLFCVALSLLAQSSSMFLNKKKGAGRVYESSIPNDSIAEDQLLSCDLLFVVNRSGNAITASTIGVANLPIDHVGIVCRDSCGVVVYEAIPHRGVVCTPLASFIAVNTPQRSLLPELLVARVASKTFDADKTKCLFTHISAPYDSLYLPDNQAIYCSELVQKTFVDSLECPIFESVPMSFHDQNGVILPYWKRFYAQFGMEVPEGMPGTNPGQLSRSSLLQVLGWLKCSTHHR